MIKNYFFNLKYKPPRSRTFQDRSKSFTHEYTGNFGQRPGKTPTPRENPRKINYH